MRRSARRPSSRCHDDPIPPQGPRQRPPSSWCGGCANNWSRPAWTPAPTPSPGTCATTTKPRCRCPRSAGSCPAKAWSSRSRPNDPGPPTYASRPSNPTRPGNPTSPTTGWPPAKTWRSSLGSTTTPGWRCTSAPMSGSPARSCSPPSAAPVSCTAIRRPRSPTTAWSTPPGSPAAAAAATTSSTSCAG